MLGFRGHFSTKSRRYSTTLGALRTARANYQRQDAISAGLLPDPAALPSTVLLVGQWHFAGRGHPPSQLGARPADCQSPSTGGGLRDEGA